MWRRPGFRTQATKEGALFVLRQSYSLSKTKVVSESYFSEASMAFQSKQIDSSFFPRGEGIFSCVIWLGKQGVPRIKINAAGILEKEWTETYSQDLTFHLTLRPPADKSFLDELNWNQKKLNVTKNRKLKMKKQKIWNCWQEAHAQALVGYKMYQKSLVFLCYQHLWTVSSSFRFRYRPQTPLWIVLSL